MEYYDDNYGHWEGMEDEDMRDFYFQTQKDSVWKKCEGCGQLVKIRKDYAICNRCAERAEHGLDY